jgi:hypothetical protein
MSGFELLKGVRDLEATLDDYLPKKWRGNERDSNSGMNGFHATPFPPPMKSRSFNLREDRNELGHSRLDEICKTIRTLTYGEMLEPAEAMWKVNSRGAEITESDLPGVLHRWSQR